MKQPFVSIVMPCFNEEAYIAGCLRSVLNQDYGQGGGQEQRGDRYEILVVDGRSTDGTPAILTAIAKEDARVRVYDNPDRLQAAGMNVALRHARGDILVRMDVHCDYAKDYVRQCVAALERTGADNVGGAQRARATTSFQRALCAALTSPLGVGGVQYRCAENEGFVDTVFLGAFRRRVFETVGMYDPRAFTNEDAELNQRIIAAGGKVFLSRDIVVHYHPRDSWTGLAKQYFRYGKGRARTLLKHGRFLSPRPAIPFLMLLGGTALVTIPMLRRFARPAFFTYALATGFEAVRVGRKAGLRAIPVVWAIFPVLHISHGVGFAAGLVTFALAPDWDDADKLAVREHAHAAAADYAANGAVNGSLG